MGNDYYTILGLPRNATSEMIRNAYFEAARKLHPDQNPENDTKEKFLEVQEAYEVLSNPKRRANYDASLSPFVEITPAVHITARYSRPYLTYSDEPQLVYALIKMRCTAEPDPAQVPPMHVCLVVDRSTSMRGEKLDAVKSNAAGMLKRLKPKDIISVVSFSDQAEVILPPTPITELGGMRERISLIQTSGSTEIYKGLEAGVDLLGQSGRGISARQLFLLTDGHTYGDEEACIRLAEEASKEGIIISSLGIGHEWNDIFLDRLACITGGSTGFAATPRDLGQLLDEKLKFLGMVYARSLALGFETGENVEVRYAFRLNPDQSPLSTSQPIQLGNLFYSTELCFLVEFLVTKTPDTISEISLAKGKIDLVLAGHYGVKAQMPLELSRSASSLAVSEKPPTEILDAMSKLTLYRMQEKARLEVQTGNIIKASQHLQRLATHLLARGDRGLAHSVMVEAERILRDHQFSDDGDKRIKYGTRYLVNAPSQGSEKP